MKVEAIVKTCHWIADLRLHTYRLESRMPRMTTLPYTWRWVICVKPGLLQYIFDYFFISIFAQSLRNFVQNTAVMLPCYVENFKSILQIKRMLWTNKISPGLCLRWVSDGYPIYIYRWRGTLQSSLATENVTVCLASTLISSVNSLINKTSAHMLFWCLRSSLLTG